MVRRAVAATVRLATVAGDRVAAAEDVLEEKRGVVAVARGLEAAVQITDGGDAGDGVARLVLQAHVGVIVAAEALAHDDDGADVEPHEDARGDVVIGASGAGDPGEVGEDLLVDVAQLGLRLRVGVEEGALRLIAGLANQLVETVEIAIAQRLDVLQERAVGASEHLLQVERIQARHDGAGIGDQLVAQDDGAGLHGAAHPRVAACSEAGAGRLRQERDEHLLPLHRALQAIHLGAVTVRVGVGRVVEERGAAQDLGHHLRPGLGSLVSLAAEAHRRRGHRGIGRVIGPVGVRARYIAVERISPVRGGEDQVLRFDAGGGGARVAVAGAVGLGRACAGEESERQAGGEGAQADPAGAEECRLQQSSLLQVHRGLLSSGREARFTVARRTVVCARQARTKVERSASTALPPTWVTEVKCAVSRSTLGAERGSEAGRPITLVTMSAMASVGDAAL